IDTFTNIRQMIVSNKMIVNLVHLGSKTFEEISGEVVQSVTFSIRQTKINNYVGKYYRMVDFGSGNEKDDMFIELIKTKKSFNMNQELFTKLPQISLMYWIDIPTLRSFSQDRPLQEFGECRSGIMTGDDSRFIRTWYEVDSTKLAIQLQVESFTNNLKKWYPINMGGFWRWYGNYLNVVNIGNKGYEISHAGNNFRLRDFKYYFRSGIAWSEISTDKYSARFVNDGTLFSSTSPMFFGYENTNIQYLLGLLNSKVSEHIFKMLNPTLHYNVSTVSILPVKMNNIDLVNHIVDENINFVENFWNCKELSWNFDRHPLIGIGILSKLFSDYKSITKSNFATLKANEEELNEYFINLYGLQNELTKEVDDAYVSISIADKVRDTKSLISYLIGVLMGRYSLSEEGLIFAGGTFDPSKYGIYDVDSDGIIPIYSDISIKDGLVHRMTSLIKEIYGIEYYRENIGFIAEALGKKSNETSEETLNRYLNDGFYQDHLKTYQKRPIYWMFSSGKSSGFKCLIYMHRYSQDTLAKINAGYFQPATTILRNQITEIERQISIAADSDKRLLEKKRMSLIEQLSEAREYGQVLDYMANKYISIDLDDGVKVNYAKFQGIEVTSNGGKVKKDLLIPIK
ncbi:MAG: BREX-1 system adenine-specific DNA-methyltransferase PglX, partial [Bacilli bacterium]|nr:BREX-1 system adenine-specific DNA-methyltransferase PglX [Bacilli bacterium]